MGIVLGPRSVKVEFSLSSESYNRETDREPEKRPECLTQMVLLCLWGSDRQGVVGGFKGRRE